jgi:hypothetical protein
MFFIQSAMRDGCEGFFITTNKNLTKKFCFLTFCFYICPDEERKHTELVVATV